MKKLFNIIFLTILMTTVALGQTGHLRLNITGLTKDSYHAVVEFKCDLPVRLADHNLILYKGSDETILSFYNNLRGDVYEESTLREKTKGDLTMLSFSTHLSDFNKPPFEFFEKDKWYTLLTFTVKGEGEVPILADETLKELANTQNVIMIHIGEYTIQALEDIIIERTIINMYNKSSDGTGLLSLIYPNPSRTLIRIAPGFSLTQIANNVYSERINITSPYDISHLQNGMYVATLYNEDTGESFTQKFVKI